MREFDEGCPIQELIESELIEEMRAEQNEYYRYVTFEEVNKENKLREYAERNQNKGRSRISKLLSSIMFHTLVPIVDTSHTRLRFISDFASHLAYNYRNSFEKTFKRS